MMMQLGAEGVFVGSGIFKSGDPAARAAAIVKATTFHDDPDVIAKVSRGLGEAMVGINLDDLDARAALRRPRLVMSPAIGVLALQGDVAEHLRAIGEAGASGVAVRRPGELDAVDGLIIPGGESTTMWKLTVIFELLDPLRKRLGAGLPVFGSCAGMIMLADRLVDAPAGRRRSAASGSASGGTRSAGRWTRSRATSRCAASAARISARSSSGRPGSRRPPPTWRFSAPSRAPVGSSRSARVPRWRRHSIPS